MLEVKDLHVNYGAVHALNGISLHVDDGEIVSLIGANGAGKTTTLRTITGLEKAASGSVMFDGHDLRKAEPSKITILLVEQNAKMALAISDRAYVLETGNISIEGNAADLLNDPRVKKAYLGQ